MSERERDYIGPDPVAWLNRLRAVNEGSQFTDAAKALIEDRLSVLQKEIGGLHAPR